MRGRDMAATGGEGANYPGGGALNENNFAISSGRDADRMSDLP
jgi:hypothetical protein